MSSHALRADMFAAAAADDQDRQVVVGRLETGFRGVVGVVGPDREDLPRLGRRTAEVTLRSFGQPAPRRP